MRRGGKGRTPRIQNDIPTFIWLGFVELGASRVTHSRTYTKIRHESTVMCCLISYVKYCFPPFALEYTLSSFAP